MEKKGQIWVETVIYTLIALVLIGAVLAIALPKIEEMQDNSVIEKSVAMMKDLDSKIALIGVPGNRRKVEIGLKKGELIINGTGDKLVFRLEAEGEYSEPGEEVIDGNLIILTEKKGSKNLVTITRDYCPDAINITYNFGDTAKSFGKSATAYNFFISREKKDAANRTVINFEVG